MRREATVLATAALLGTALAAGAARHLSRRLDREVAPALTHALGATVSIGDASAGLTGSVRLLDLQIGGLLRADAVEVGTSWRSLASASLRADLVRVENPTLSVHADGRGYSNLERIARRALAARARAKESGSAGESRAPRRLVVTGGDLVVDLGARGELRVADVELSPAPGGVRAVAGEVAVDLRSAGAHLAGRFDRAAADFDVAALSRGASGPARFLADGGELSLEPGAGAEPVQLSRAVIAGGLGGAEIELRAQIAEPGRPGSVRLALSGAAIEIEAEAAPLRAASALLPAWVDTHAATVTGAARVQPSRFSLDARVDDLALRHRRLAAVPVALGFGLELSGSRTRAGGELAVTLDRGAVTLGELRVRVAGTARFGASAWPAATDLAFELEPAPCDAVVASLPAAVRDPLVGLAADGELSGRASLRFSRDRPRATEIEVDLDAAGCDVTAEAAAADPRAFVRGGQITLPDGRVRRFVPGAPGYVPLSEIPEHVQRAFIAAEDGPFFRHRGFDLHQIERSLAANLSAGALRRGGSTITQQLAKNLFLRRDRTLARKLQEALLTWRLERVLGKRRILELYLNLIELSGRDHYGIAEAAEHWLGATPAELSLRQAAFLAALTSEPTSMSARLRAAGGVDPESAARIDAVLSAMRRDRHITAAELARARAERLELGAAVLAAR